MKKDKNPGAPMVIGLDAKRAVMNNTGLGNYSRYMINIMSLAFPSTRFRLYSPSSMRNERLEPLLDRENVELAVPNLRFGKIGQALWRTIDMPVDLKKDDIAVYHGLSNELPLTIKGVCPSVVTIHDIIYRRSPGDYTAIDRKLYDFKYSRSARNATRIIAISERTKADLVQDYGISPDKIDVIYQGVDPIFTLKVDSSKKQEVRARYRLPSKYLVTVGTVQPRKNQLLAVRALAGMPDDISLVIVGRMDSAYAVEVKREIARLGLSDRVVMPSDVAFTDLPAIYADARASLYTSRYEGFGIPVVESLSVGTPVIACTGSCLEEAGGAGAVYVNPDDVDGCREAAIRMVEDTVFHDRTVRLGQQHVRKFSADAFAKATMATYKKAILEFML